MNVYLVYPMFAMVLLTALVMISMFVTRVSAIKSGKMNVRYFKTYDMGDQTEAVAKSSRHFVNLFELPVLFYVGCLVAMILPINDKGVLFWAWFFVLARVVHAYIHIGPNKLIPRMSAYAVGWVAVLALWIDIIVAVSMNLK